MKNTTNPTCFIETLKTTTKCTFSSDELRAEVTRVSDKTSKREIMIRYFHKLGDVWQSFGFCVSPFPDQIINDFKTECKAYGIC